ncbi:hypothetical protein [Brumicola blandensis]|uniref:Uncharacterized protein n=1 Tax=Brumicola blandensis TaxID=3075611 RepID=A0AAW8R0N2_9ALTE|nr:hypothetical protein [Alteromonas sp. W409]MDT0582841.1 hypothetical protein [Alteromonas sp. W409]
MPLRYQKRDGHGMKLSESSKIDTARMMKEGLPMRSDIFNIHNTLLTILLCTCMLFMANPAQAKDNTKVSEFTLDMLSTNAALISSEQTYLGANNSNEASTAEGLNDAQFEIHEAWFYVMGIIILVLALKSKDGSEKNEADRDNN